MITGLQAIYKAQIFQVVSGLETVLDEAIILRAKSRDSSWEQKEATKMVVDIERWLRCWREYGETIRLDPTRMFAH